MGGHGGMDGGGGWKRDALAAQSLHAEVEGITRHAHNCMCGPCPPRPHLYLSHSHSPPLPSPTHPPPLPSTPRTPFHPPVPSPPWTQGAAPERAQPGQHRLRQAFEKHPGIERQGSQGRRCVSLVAKRRGSCCVLLRGGTHRQTGGASPRVPATAAFAPWTTRWCGREVHGGRLGWGGMQLGGAAAGCRNAGGRVLSGGVGKLVIKAAERQEICARAPPLQMCTICSMCEPV